MALKLTSVQAQRNNSDRFFLVTAPILASEKSLQMKFLLDSVKLLDEKQVPQFLKQVLANMVTIKGRDKAGEIMRRSNLSLSQLMPSEKVADFIASSVSFQRFCQEIQYDDLSLSENV